MDKINRKNGTYEVLFHAKGNVDDTKKLEPFLVESRIPEEEHFYGNMVIEQTLMGIRVHLDLIINGVFDMDTGEVIPPRVYLELIRRHISNDGRK